MSLIRIAVFPAAAILVGAAPALPDDGDSCNGCRWDHARILSPTGSWHAVPLRKSMVGRAHLAARYSPVLLEVSRCTAGERRLRLVP